jgi:hypothetical protein
MTTPLLSVPVVVVVPLDVPVRLPAFNVKTLPLVFEVIVRLRVPLTVFVELVVKLAFPVALSALVPLAKHAPALKKAKPVMSRGPLFVTVNVVTKFNKLACSVPPVSWPSQFPVAWVFVTVEVLLVAPHPQTASSSARAATRANFFIQHPSIGITTRIERCGQSRQWM